MSFNIHLKKNSVVHSDRTNCSYLNLEWKRENDNYREYIINKKKVRVTKNSRQSRKKCQHRVCTVPVELEVHVSPVVMLLVWSVINKTHSVY